VNVNVNVNVNVQAEKTWDRAFPDITDDERQWRPFIADVEAITEQPEESSISDESTTSTCLERTILINIIESIEYIPDNAAAL
jgi:hypothetical protein